MGWALGKYSLEYLSKLQANGEDLPMPDFEDWIGSSCLIKVKHKSDQNDVNKKYTTIGFDYTRFDSVIGQATGVILDTSCIDAEQNISASNDEDTADDFF